jgi:hypothetical protein
MARSRTRKKSPKAATPEITKTASALAKAKAKTQAKSSKPKTPPMSAQKITDIDAEKATRQIKNWTTQEITHLHKVNRTPVCVPTSDGYRIGLYKLNCQDNRYRLYDANQTFVHEFDSKASAVLYAIFSIKNNVVKAAEILDLDQDINKNYMDVVMLSRRITGLQRQNDWTGAEIREYRLEIAERRLEALRDKISKIHRSAKYNKIWD